MLEVEASIEEITMKNASNRVLALSISAGALLAAAGLGVLSGGFAVNVQAAPDSPVHLSPTPSTPPPQPPPPPAMTQVPDYSTGQDSSGGGGGGG